MGTINPEGASRTIAGISEIFGQSIPVDPAFAINNLLERRRQAEQIVGQLGVFSPLSALTEVVGDEETAKILKKYAMDKLDKIDKIPMGIAYAMFGTTYPQLLRAKQENEDLLLKLKAIYGGKEEGVSVKEVADAIAKSKQEQLNKIYIKDKNGDYVVKEQNLRDAFKTIRTQGDQDLRTISNAYSILIDKYYEALKNGYIDEANKLKENMDNLDANLQWRALGYYVDKKDPTKWNKFIDLMGNLQAVKEAIDLDKNKYKPDYNLAAQDIYSKAKNIKIENIQNAINQLPISSNGIQKAGATALDLLGLQSLIDLGLRGGEGLFNIVSLINNYNKNQGQQGQMTQATSTPTPTQTMTEPNTINTYQAPRPQQLQRP